MSEATGIAALILTQGLLAALCRRGILSKSDVAEIFHTAEVGLIEDLSVSPDDAVLSIIKSLEGITLASPQRDPT